ncbi:MAG: polyphosphate polymerase domain-containing protein [Muribaculaceae bacterium]|nr:polyphosphate polymerase domain-containing protein [Muribaculaceae bacterium]
MKQFLHNYQSISLDKVKKGVKLMNRLDTKYVMTERQLAELLRRAADDYYVQQIGEEVVMPYRTVYFDTPDFEMYNLHHNGKLTRKKVRIRSYLDSGVDYLEVKRKNNKGRTDKQRVRYDENLSAEHRHDFLMSMAGYDDALLSPKIENSFSRITLVNRKMTERITIDTSLRFSNPNTGLDYDLEGLVIIELKRDGKAHSPVAEMLREMRVFPSGFSKYCIGMALTSPALSSNRFKPRLRRIKKLLSK